MRDVEGPEPTRALGSRRSTRAAPLPACLRRRVRRFDVVEDLPDHPRRRGQEHLRHGEVLGVLVSDLAKARIRPRKASCR
jgi:hypothetical protein